MPDESKLDNERDNPMNASQRAYAKAKARYEAIREMRDSEMKRHKHLREEGRVDEYYKINGEFEYAHGYWDAFEALTLAEKAMIDACFDAVKSHPMFKANAKDFEELKEKAPLYPKQYKALVDISFRLNTH